MEESQPEIGAGRSADGGSHAEQDAWPFIFEAMEPRATDGGEAVELRTRDLIDAFFRDLIAETFQCPPGTQWPRPDGVRGLRHPFVLLSVFAREFALIAANTTAPSHERVLARLGVATGYVLRGLHGSDETWDRMRRSAGEPVSPTYAAKLAEMGLDAPKSKTPDEVEARLPHLGNLLRGWIADLSLPRHERDVLRFALDGRAGMTPGEFVHLCRALLGNEPAFRFEAGQLETDIATAESRSGRQPGVDGPVRATPGSATSDDPLSGGAEAAAEHPAVIPRGRSAEQPGAKVAGGATLEIIAMAEFSTSPTFSRAELARRIGCHRSTLAKARAPLLAGLLERAREEARRSIGRGSKSKDGVVEAYADEDDDMGED